MTLLVTALLLFHLLMQLFDEANLNLHLYHPFQCIFHRM